MSTRGYLGIKKRGELKGQYNHFDSYFDGLGRYIVSTLNKFKRKGNLLEVLNNTFDNIVLVDDNNKPTKEQQDYCIEHSLVDLNVSSKDLEDWYCLLRETQGNLELYLNGCKYMYNGNEFLKDKLFCEYAYIINLDTNKLDIYSCGDSNLICSRSLYSLSASSISKFINKKKKRTKINIPL